METVKTRNPDLVLTDIFMPEMDGFEFERGLISYDESIPVIAMSGNNKSDKTSFQNMISMLGRAIENYSVRSEAIDILV